MECSPNCKSPIEKPLILGRVLSGNMKPEITYIFEIWSIGCDFSVCYMLKEQVKSKKKIFFFF